MTTKQDMEALNATLLDEDFQPLGCDFVITDDDFSAPIAAAKAAGRTCCIWWSREIDGQAAYYGPRGCSLQPHWYN